MKIQFFLIALFAIHLQVPGNPWLVQHSMYRGSAPNAPTITGPATVCQASTGNVYQTEPGYSNYVWTVSSGGTITAGGGTSDYTVTVTWNTQGAQTVSVNYDNPPGTPYPSPTLYNVTVKPKPVLTTSPLSKMICNSTNTNIALTSNVPGTTFSWTASLTSGSVMGYSNGSGNLISQTLNNTGFTVGTVTYAITPQANGCIGNVCNYVVTVNPTPFLSNSPLNQVQCNNFPTNITLYSFVAGATFTWTATGTSSYITGYGPGSGNYINQVLVNQGSVVEAVTYHIAAFANGCSGPIVNFVVTVFPSAVPTVAGPTPVIAGSTGNVYATETGLAGYLWTISAGGVIVGSAAGSSCTVSWNDAGSQWVKVRYYSGGCLSVTTEYPVEVLLPVTRIWTGTIDNDWGTAENWSPQGIPEMADDVVIQNTSLNFPVVNVSGFSCHDLTIQPGATFTITPGVTLTITGTVVMENE